MPSMERVTVTLPAEMIEGIDRVERNRSRFILQAVRRELERRRRDELRRSLAAPHPDAEETAGKTIDQGFDEWAAGLPPEDATGLVDKKGGRAVRWVPRKGWVESRK